MVLEVDIGFSGGLVDYELGLSICPVGGKL